MYHYVKFHADGGGACIHGLRRFSDTETADKFADLMRDEPGHQCKDSVACFSSIAYLEEEGHLTLREQHPSLSQEFYKEVLQYTHNEPEND
jgi:hypothetical protein